MSLKDAKPIRNRIFALFVDLIMMSTLLNTGHDGILWIMYDLGFSTDAINTVKNLYEDSFPQVRLPSRGSTQKVLVERGTIQGDTLSPFHFLLNKEPFPTVSPCGKMRLQTHVHP